jgi:hypothetical protein
VVLLGGAALLVVASAGFWIGSKSVVEQSESPPQHARTATTVQLPPARPAPEVRLAPQPEVRLAPIPEVRPSETRQVRLTPLPSEDRSNDETARPSAEDEQSTSSTKTQQAAPSASAVAPQAHPFVLPKPWPPTVVQGASGRLVQVGAFGSIHQAKRGWWFMVRAYPAMAHLPAVVRPARNSHGRVFYRFQVGTTSQAHSEVLCQRMVKISLSCAVIGLPWKSKVER